MEEKKATRKTLEELPQFSVNRLEVRPEPDSLWLHGTFDRIDGVEREVGSWDYLYVPGPPWLPATVVSFDEVSKEAAYEVAQGHAGELGVAEGSKLAWLGSVWKPAVLDAVLDAGKGWVEHVFQASDAVRWRFVDADGKKWIGERNAAFGVPKDVTEHWIEPLAWDHEHCEVCWKHVDPGDTFFTKNWSEDEIILCAACHRNHAMPHDLSFLFPKEPIA